MEANKYEDHESEIEAIQYIFMDDLSILEEKPYKFEVIINSNNEKE